MLKYYCNDDKIDFTRFSILFKNLKLKWQPLFSIGVLKSFGEYSRTRAK